MTVRLITLAVWIVAVAGGLAWLLPLTGKSSAVPPQAVMALPPPVVAAGGAERLLGTPPPAEASTAPPVTVESRYKLIGVIAPRFAGGSGLALISVDGQPPRAVTVGREVDAGTRVIAVSHRRVDLGATPGAPTATLELPPIAEASRGRPGDVPPAVNPAAAPLPVPMPAPTLPLAAGRQRPGAMFGSPRIAVPQLAAPMLPNQPLGPAEQAVEAANVPGENRAQQ